MKWLLIAFICTLTMSCSSSDVKSKATAEKKTEIANSEKIQFLEIEKLIITPNADGHRDFINAILEAKEIIQLKVFHLTDNEVIEALIKAKGNGVLVQVILDRKSMILGKFKKAYKKLLENKIEVYKSTKKFSITHEKSMLVDHKMAFVTAINLTKNAHQTRDFGIMTSNKDIISEMELVFKTDVSNSINNQGLTPELVSPFLIWSPVNSRDKIIHLIEAATKTIDLEVENLGDLEIQKALIEAAEKNVEVRLLVPLCDKNFNPFHNISYIKKMTAEKILARVMSSPSTIENPYMHSKMIVVDGRYIYIGSINFSNNSTQKARELGIIFSNDKVAHQILEEFRKDWDISVLLPKDRSRIKCFKDMKGSL
ncbi:MAG: phospholipase D-like domain-containing protein [Pseudobdellovibrio sp.]